MAAAAELTLLEKSLGLSKGNKYSAQGERQIPVLQTNSGPSLTGLTTIAAHLVKQANKEHLLGSSAEEKAVVQQWLEFRVTRVDGQSSKDDIRTVLKDLNSYLEDKVYLTGYNFTLADILLYYGLHRFIPLPVKRGASKGWSCSRNCLRGDKLWSRTALFAAYAALYGFLQKRRKEQRRTLDLTVSENNTAQQWAKYYSQTTGTYICRL
ncbi:eukaryotic translation elongation factor 1 epsilon-1 isoform X1 [Sus scrofa]|uniref:eukaryotic translation elongation factor 1 epsilon-1 isoform X1 n=1 Tax=Sus scrofa TaxID=9823 RepID=UPI000A2B23E9|nr:eukaryotic translation elongation factor 1 epsilon-1 isoform X1 [Sus scrofa]